MLFLHLILDLIHRFSHPNSLPRDVATDLGLEVYPRMGLGELLEILQDPNFRSDNLRKSMHKGVADTIFKHAARKDIFHHTSRFSYLFNQGVLEFALHFDQDERLRRTALHFHHTKGGSTIELPLTIDQKPITYSRWSLTENLSQR